MLRCVTPAVERQILEARHPNGFATPVHAGRGAVMLRREGYFVTRLCQSHGSHALGAVPQDEIHRGVVLQQDDNALDVIRTEPWADALDDAGVRRTWGFLEGLLDGSPCCRDSRFHEACSPNGLFKAPRVPTGTWRPCDVVPKDGYTS